MKRFCIAIVFYPVIVFSQPKIDVVMFDSTSEWDKVLEKAKSEYKGIFLYCTANDCPQCVNMEQQIFLSPAIAHFLQDNYISLLFRIDTSQKLDINTWPVANPNFRHQYRISQFPFYMFFDLNGKLVHLGYGHLDEQKFVSLMNAASDPARQFIPLIENYRAGKIDYPLLGKLAITAKALRDTALANTIAADYKNNYLDHLKDGDLCRSGNIDFINNFLDLFGPKDRFFSIAWNNPNLIDKETLPGYAASFIRYIIFREEIKRVLWKDGKAVTNEPNWKAISDSIQKKYGEGYVKQMLPSTKVNFYRKIENWKEYAKQIQEEIIETPPKDGTGLDRDAWVLNGRAWDIFLHCKDTEVLNLALHWSTLTVEIEPFNNQYLDTKANILYKIGKVSEAIAIEEMAMRQENASAIRRGLQASDLVADYKNNLEKMKAGSPTW